MVFSRSVAAAVAAFLLVCLTISASANQRPVAMATSLRISTAGDLTQIQLDLSGAVTFDASVSSIGTRVLVHATDLGFSLPRGAGTKAKGLVRRIRYGKTTDGTSELAIDTTSAVIIRKSYLAVAKRSKQVRMTIVLAAKPSDHGSDPAEDLSSPEITGSLPSVVPAIPATIVGRKHVIVIDPGHGGIDPGAISSSGTKEKDVVLSFAKALQTALLANGNIEVVLTRDDDRFLALQSRVELARAKQADLFIAVHADTLSQHSVRGATLYTLSDKASDAEAEALAQKENRADDIAGVNLQQQSSTIADVLVNLAQRESKNRAAMFAEVAVEKLKSATVFTGKPMRSAGFMVLKAPDVPSVLVELGYLSNAQDAKNMNDETWRSSFAKAMAAAVADHFSGAAPLTAQASP
jgi:N-acetylmuramoyl-L-alanine amidase